MLHVDGSNCGCTAGPDGSMRNVGRSEPPDPEDTQPGIRWEVAVGGGTGRSTDRGVRPTVGVQRLDTHRCRGARADVVLGAFSERLAASGHGLPKAADASIGWMQRQRRDACDPKRGSAGHGTQHPAKRLGARVVSAVRPRSG